MKTATKHRSAYPRAIARFSNLDGGYYGTMELLAQSPERLEVQMGSDFVQLTPEQAEDLRDALQTFIDFTAKHGGAAETEPTSEGNLAAAEMAVAVEEVEEAGVGRPRPRRRKARDSA